MDPIQETGLLEAKPANIPMEPTIGLEKQDEFANTLQ